ncbi:MAG: SAM-dependent methyltransferase [Proteobacteria bacterium]|nr:SAM-dependent methyltransferase [Pseudomonadota bacterium]
MTSLADHLRRRIADDGPLSVAEYMELALTHPRLGYYMSRDPFGRGGDFITAPEISQMFGELIGLWCSVQWQAMGGPDSVNLVELGPGRGTLMADMLRAGGAVEGFVESLSVSLVEISPVLKTVQEDALVGAKNVLKARSLQWWSDFSEVPEGPLLLVANEFLDALPVRQFQKTHEGWRERMVGVSGDQKEFRFILADGPPQDGAIPPDLSGAGAMARDGVILEVRPAAAALAEAIAGRLARQTGAALFIDYGHAESAAGDTLQAVKDHEYRDPLVAPGEADLTAHVDFAAFGRAAAGAGARVWGPVGQGAFLEGLGIGVRAEALMAAEPAQGREIEAAVSRLTSEDAMGRLFKVMALVSPGLPPPPGFE